VRVDFSLREKPFFMETSFIETIFPVGPYPQVCHLKIEELMAEKIRAILTRTRGRDIFDVYFLLSKNVSFDLDLINKKMAYYKKSFNSKDLIKVIEKFPQQEIKEDLTRFLPLTHRNLIEKIKNLTLEKLEFLR
ncbi:MAG: nucleotidyl transferase AbiEii/AbiGii toxin family protein, partial [Candidatus Omnitrophica bacterium]|nr:nucleotidyl transferase AbiEii/AbiGii toxin family protein [Candidatus Omnitrophota bacterium]